MGCVDHRGCPPLIDYTYVTTPGVLPSRNIFKRAAERSEWDPESLQEGRYDVAKNMKLFEEANAHYRTG